MPTTTKPIKPCPQCGKSYGISTRKNGTIRCRLCGYEGNKDGSK